MAHMQIFPDPFRPSCSLGLQHESIDFGKYDLCWKILTEAANQGT